MANVIRQDVIEIGFKSDLGTLNKINDGMDKLKKSVSNDVDDGLGKLKKSAGEAKKSVSSLGKTDGVDKLKKEVNKVADDMNDLGDNTKKTKKFLDRFKNTDTSKLNSGLNKVKNNLSNIAKKASGVAYRGLKKIAGISFKALIGGLGASAAAIGGLVTKSVTAYADYEQLIGGVETLLGAKGAKSVQEYAKLTGKSVGKVKGEYKKLNESQKIVVKNANNAFKTAGLSANDYMETVTGFAASLLQSTGNDTKKAAKLADVAVSDMADNANKMGTDMSSIQWAYQGFAKQNYTMLDNLKLGYGGTKTEMQRLVKDASKLDKSIDGNSLSYGNIVKAIHAVQKETGIYGTTQKEAEHTIQGSLNSMKSAWGNLMPALIQGGDAFDQCVDNLVETAGTFMKNIKPAIVKALSGVGKLIETLAPTIEKEFPVLVNKLLPPLIQATVSLVKGLVIALPSIIKIIVAEIPTIAKELGSAIGEVFNSISVGGNTSVFSGIFGDIKSAISVVIPTISNFIQKIGEFFKQKSTLDAIKSAWDKIKMAVKAVWFVVEPIISLIANNLDTIIPVIMNVVKVFIALKVAIALVNFVMAASPITWIIAGIVALIAVIALCVKHWDKIKAAGLACLNAIKTAWGTVCEWFNTTIIQPIKNFFIGLWNSIKNIANSIYTNAILPVVTAIRSAVQTIFGVLLKIGTFIYNNVIMPIVNFVKGFATAIMVIVLGVIGLICKGVVKIATWINTNVIQPVWNAICTVWGKISSWVNTNVIRPIVRFFISLWNKIKGVIQAVKTTICTVWSKVSGWVNANVIQPIVRYFAVLWARIKTGVKIVWSIFRSIWGKISSWVNSRVIQPIVKFFTNLWSRIKSIASGIKNTLVEAFKSAWDKVTGVWNGLKKFFTGIWNGLKDTGNSLKNTLVGIWKSAVSAISKPVNKLIGGANWVLEKLGSKTRVAEWQPYAKGTDGHKGGNALVNDGKGAELVQMPNGQSFIPKGRNVLIPNAPKGMKVLPAKQTANLAGKSTPTFRYKDGTGFDIWEYFGKAKGLASKVIEKYVSYGGLSGYTLEVGKSMISKTKGALSNWVSRMFNKFGGKDISSYVASKGVEQWRSTVVKALKMEHQYSEDNVKRTLYQMQTESGGNPRAINNWDSNAKKGTPSKGLMQVIDPTFRAYARKGYNKNIYDPLSNILASIRYAVSRYGSLARAYQGHGYSNGGLVTKTGLIAEKNKPEWVIPTDPAKRKRSLNLWQQAGNSLGVRTANYSPESGTSQQGANRTENNTYAPVFNLTVSGTSDDRTTARKVKKWVQEAMEEVFEGIATKNPKVKEV